MSEHADRNERDRDAEDAIRNDIDELLGFARRHREQLPTAARDAIGRLDRAPIWFVLVYAKEWISALFFGTKLAMSADAVAVTGRARKGELTPEDCLHIVGVAERLREELVSAHRAARKDIIEAKQEGTRSTVTRCANWLFNRGEGELCGAMLEELGELGWEGIPWPPANELRTDGPATPIAGVEGPPMRMEFTSEESMLDISRKLDADMARYFQEHFPAKMDIDSNVGTPYLDTLDPEFRERIEARAGAVRAVGRFIRALGDPE